ncbi:nuclear transport factor 2 family protein [Xanthomonas melonis]|nr:nuclear transport factor 2 family protein [Xanthomonas melonis]MCC4600421.1 nuclear transport factor 2 family protein [Xanthomonas melonis]
MTTLEQRLQRLEDESAIRALVARFADTCIRADHDGFKALWTDDGIWEIGAPFNLRRDGIEAIAALLHQLRDERNFFTQLVPTGVIVIEGDRAAARWPVRELATGPEDHYYDNVAMYSDTFVRTASGWRFSSRSYTYLWLNTEPFGGQSFGTPQLP